MSQRFRIIDRNEKNPGPGSYIRFSEFGILAPKRDDLDRSKSKEKENKNEEIKNSNSNEDNMNKQKDNSGENLETV